MPRIVDVDERRAALARAAAEVIASRGLSAASLREIASAAGWTTGALTHYFPDKRALLRFTLETSLAHRRARGAARDGLPPDEALRASLVDALPVDEESRLHWIVTLAFCAQAAGDPELAEVQQDAYREFRAALAERVRAAGRATADGALAEAERLIAVLDGVSLQALFDPASWPAARQRAAIDAALASGGPGADVTQDGRPGPPRR